MNVIYKAVDILVSIVAICILSDFLIIRHAYSNGIGFFSVLAVIIFSFIGYCAFSLLINPAFFACLSMKTLVIRK